MHLPEFFQPTLLNSKFLYKRGALIVRLVLVNIPVPAQIKKKVLKALFVLMSPSIVNKPVNCQYYVSKESKNVFHMV